MLAEIDSIVQHAYSQVERQIVNREALAGALRHARENRGMSQQAVADVLGLSRTVIAQIELGNRLVSADELGQFATLYETSISDLTGRDQAGDLETLAFEWAPDLFEDDKARAVVKRVLALLEMASSLERILERRQPAEGPHYSAVSSEGLVGAIVQAERAAEQERRRLGFGAAPLADASELVASQNVRVSAVDLPDDIVGFFLRHSDSGSAAVVNSKYRGERRRYAILHCYAFGLFERGDVLRVTTSRRSDAIATRRADAFAVALLLPAQGLRDFLDSIDKGQPSRKAYAVLDVATDDMVRVERRSAPRSQSITFSDVAAIARRFGVSYQATVVRLLSLGFISETESSDLLNRRQQRAAEQCLVLTGSARTTRPVPSDGSRRLEADVIHLAIECYRRERITKDRLAEIGGVLQLPDLPKAKLLELAEAAR
jgi:transcriptional regulator with XRE-family HTH domain/Zn-dependent peptidase ImmA (M78 family)